MLRVWSLRPFVVACLVGTLVGRAWAQPPEAPSGYVESIETAGNLGSEEDEVDAGAVQAESFEATGRVSGVSRRQAGTVEEIVVQARKRDEFLEDTPVSVTALSESALRESGVGRVHRRRLPTARPGHLGGYRRRPTDRGSARSAGDALRQEHRRRCHQYNDREAPRRARGVRHGAPGQLRSDRYPVHAERAHPDRLFARFSFASSQTPGYSFNSFRNQRLNGKNSLAFLGALRSLPHDDVTIDLTGTRSKDHNNGNPQP